MRMGEVIQLQVDQGRLMVLGNPESHLAMLIMMAEYEIRTDLVKVGLMRTVMFGFQLEAKRLMAENTGTCKLLGVEDGGEDIAMCTQEAELDEKYSGNR